MFNSLNHWKSQSNTNVCQVIKAIPSLPRGTHRKDGGTSSGGKVRGKGCPALAMSVRCIARMNSSAFSCPSPSMSARVLKKMGKFTAEKENLNLE